MDDDQIFLRDLRDKFAGQAMSAIICSPDTGKLNPQELAVQAYIVADAMLKERIKKY